MTLSRFIGTTAIPGTGFFDFDHDGWKDIFAANGHVYPEVVAQLPGSSYKQAKLLYWNLGDGTFRDVSAQAGAGIRAPRAGRGAAFGDLDNDGRLEIVVNNMNETPSLLVNGGVCGNSVLVQTVGKKSNRNGIGARVQILAGGLKQMNEVRSGSSYLSHNDFRLHFGVGKAQRLDRLEVQWPGGRVDSVSDVGVNSIITVEEGKGIVGQKPLGKPFAAWH